MPEYEFVNVRFNIEREDENYIFSKLNPKNKGGSIKDALKKFYAVDSMKKTEIKSILKEIIEDEIYPEDDLNIKEDISIHPNRIKIMVNGREQKTI